MSEIKTKIRTYNDVIDLFGEEKAADMLSEALGWSTIDPKNDKKNIMERKPLLLDPYMTYEDEDYCKHIVAGFLGDRDLDWASGYIDEEKIKNGQVMPADLKSALSMALDKQARDMLAENSKHDRSLAAVRDAKTAVADKVNEGHQVSSVHDNPSH